MTVVKIKKAKHTKKCVIRRKLLFENYKSCLEAIQFENNINHLENNKININSLYKNYREFVRNNSKTQNRFKSEKRNVFTEEIDNIALSSNHDKRMQSNDSLETYAYETSEDLLNAKEEIKCNNIIKRLIIQKIINFDDVIKENIKGHNPSWPETSDHPEY